MTTNGPKDRAKTDVTIPPRTRSRTGLKLLHLMEPSAQNHRTTSGSEPQNHRRVQQNLGAGGTVAVLGEAVAPQQEDAVRRRHVQEDVLQVEQDGEQQRPLQVVGLNRKQEMMSSHRFYLVNISDQRRF